MFAIFKYLAISAFDNNILFVPVEALSHCYMHQPIVPGAFVGDYSGDVGDGIVAVEANRVTVLVEFSLSSIHHCGTCDDLHRCTI